jgi:hypothetical protein
MKLGKLLGMGKSFFGSDPMAAYQLNKRACLPKFNEGRNPFAPKTDLNAAETALSAPKAETKTSVPAEARAQKAPPPYAFKPAAKPAAKLSARQMATPVAKAPRSGWTTRLNPFRPPEPVAPPTAEQTELSLNAVKVMHNDLADADVEIVPVSSHANTSVTAAVLPPARQAWEYLGEGLLKSR